MELRWAVQLCGLDPDWGSAARVTLIFPGPLLGSEVHSSLPLTKFLPDFPSMLKPEKFVSDNTSYKCFNTTLILNRHNINISMCFCAHRNNFETMETEWYSQMFSTHTSGGSMFKSQHRNWLNCLRFLRFSLVPPGKFLESTLIRLWLFPSISFPVHQSSYNSIQ